jgi:hypothetical protein
MARHGSYPLGGENPPRSTFYDQGKFGRIFPSLPPFAADTPSVRAALKELGEQGGRMDAKDAFDFVKHPDLARDLIIKPELFMPNNPDNPRMTAGMTFLGQFLDHDLTLDPTSSLERQVDPEAIQNFRTPAFELDNVYGGGPNASPHLYDQNIDHGLTSLLVEENVGAAAVSVGGFKRYDVPRNSQNTAIISDPRNDENLILSQLQLAMLKFHNAVVAHVKADLGMKNPNDIFAEAQRLVRWHYQWIIVNEFLPLTVGDKVMKDILKNGRKVFKWRNTPYIPVEFSVAAYRFGHSQVRPSYRSNFGLHPKTPLFMPATNPPTPPKNNPDATQVFRLIFNANLDDTVEDTEDLRGGKRSAKRFIDWQTFFDFGDGRVRNNKIIDAKLSTILFDLPGFSKKGEIPSLAQRNLFRHVTFGMPSGQSVAKAMKMTPLSSTDLQDLRALHLDAKTPLWYYILKEAEVQNSGKFLGEVGGRIVAEVFIGLLEGDSMSYLRQDREWLPTLPSAKADDFKMIDLLKFAGVVANLDA